MNYAFKPTTHGRALIAACMALEAPLKLTRGAVGSGRVAEDINLADMHQLIHYEAEGSLGERRHENDRLYLTVQYSNRNNPDLPTFLLSEFIVYAEDPATGEDTDLLYATLGDYVQSVPPCSMDFPEAVWNFPLILVLSDAVDVTVSAPAGLVTYDDLLAVINSTAVRQMDVTIPAEGWEDTGEGLYPLRLELPLEVTAQMIPMLTVLPESSAQAAACGLAPFAQTGEDVLRLWAEKAPEEAMRASLTLLRNASGFGAGTTTLLPPATSERLGGVKVGEGLRVTEDGTLSVDAADEAEVAEMLGEVFGPQKKEG